MHYAVARFHACMREFHNVTCRCQTSSSGSVKLDAASRLPSSGTVGRAQTSSARCGDLSCHFKSGRRACRSPGPLPSCRRAMQSVCPARNLRRGPLETCMKFAVSLTGRIWKCKITTQPGSPCIANWRGNASPLSSSRCPQGKVVHSDTHALLFHEVLQPP